MKRQGTSSAVEHGLPPAEEGSEPIYRLESALSLAAANSYTTGISNDFEITGIYVHFSGATNTAVTISLDAKGGVNYDTVIYTKTLAANTDFAFIPEGGEMEYEDGDEIKVGFTLSAGITAYLTILYKLR